MRSAFWAAAALVMSIETAGAAVIVFSDDFNTETRALNGSLTQWTVTSGAVDVLGPGLFDFYPGNGNYVDLDGSTNRAGRIKTASLGLNKATTYELTFDLGVNGTNREVLVVGLGKQTFRIRIPAGGIGPSMMQVTRTFTAIGPRTSLFFKAKGRDNQGPVIDNVQLADVSDPATAVRLPATAVPLPATAPLALVALGALGLLARRRRS